MKIGLVSSSGGHLTEILSLLEAFQDHEVFIVTYRSQWNTEVLSVGRAYFIDNIGTNPWRLFIGSLRAARILLKEKPGAIVSMGSEIALPFFFLSKLLHIKTIYIESWCRVKNLSLTGRLVYPIADIFLVQWPDLLTTYGTKARYEGAVI